MSELSQPTRPSPSGLKSSPGSTLHLIRAGALRHFSELVASLGGDPRSLLQKVALDEEEVTSGRFVSYQKMAELLHRTALTLNRPDFGLLLAAHQGGMAILGPLEVAMRNCPTVGDAMSYYMAHFESLGSATYIVLEREPSTGRPFLRHEMHVPNLRHCQQVVEHALGLVHDALFTMSGGSVRSREVWISHAPLSPIAHYRRYFGARVEVDMPYSGVFVDEADLAVPIPNTARDLFDLADSLMREECSSGRALSVQVRSILMRELAQGSIDKAGVARKLNLHPKTLQRRLGEEGKTFEMLREQVRREAAKRYLTESAIPVTQVAAMLGYSEAAVLCRRCREWFGCSPRELRYRKGEIPEDTSATHESRGRRAKRGDEAGRIAELEEENVRLRRLVSELMLTH